MYVQLAFLPQLQRAHGGEGLGDRSQVESRMIIDRIQFPRRIAKPLVALKNDHAILGHQDTAIEMSPEHRIEKTIRDRSIMLQFRPCQRRRRHGYRDSVNLSGFGRLSLTTRYN